MSLAQLARLPQPGMERLSHPMTEVRQRHYLAGAGGMEDEKPVKINKTVIASSPHDDSNINDIFPLQRKNSGMAPLSLEG